MRKCMTANELADELDDIDAYEKHQTLLGKASEMLRQQQAEIEALKANRKHDFGLGEASGFIKGHKENPYQSITNTKIEPTVVNYTHPHPDNLGLAESIIKQQEIQIEALKAEVKQWEEWKESLNGWSKK